jgi:hypothetical protein
MICNGGACFAPQAVRDPKVQIGECANSRESPLKSDAARPGVSTLRYRSLSEARKFSIGAANVFGLRSSGLPSSLASAQGPLSVSPSATARGTTAGAARCSAPLRTDSNFAGTGVRARDVG